MFEHPIPWLRSLPIVPLTWNSQLQTLEGYHDSVRCVAFSPGDLLLASGASDGIVEIWNVMTGEQVQRLAHDAGGVHKVAFSPDHNSMHLVSATEQKIILWDVPTGERLLEFYCDSEPRDSVVFSSDGHLLFSASSGIGTVMVWNAVTGGLVRTINSIHIGDVDFIRISPNCELFSSVYDTRNLITIQSTTTGQLVQQLENCNWLPDISFSFDGQQCAMRSGVGRTKRFRIWNLNGGKVVQQVGESIHYFGAIIIFSPNGQLLATASEGGRVIQLWDTKTGEQVQQLEGHTSHVCAIAFSFDNKLIASASYYDTVRLWKVEMGERVEQSEAVSDFVNILKLSPDGQIVASASGPNTTVKLWKITGEFLSLLRVDGMLTDIAFCPKGQMLALHLISRVMLWNVATGILEDWITESLEPLLYFAPSPNGQILALVDATNEELRIWTPTGELVRKLQGVKCVFSAAALSADGTQFATSSSTEVVIWDLARETALRSKCLYPLGDELVFSPDSNLLALKLRDGTSNGVAIWSTTSGQLLEVIATSREVSGFRFSGDNRYLRTNRGTLRLNFHWRAWESAVPMSTVGIFLDKGWVTYNGKKLLWVPQDYRGTSSVVEGKHVIIGQRSGHIDFLEFNPEAIS